VYHQQKLARPALSPTGHSVVTGVTHPRPALQSLPSPCFHQAWAMSLLKQIEVGEKECALTW